MRINARLSDSYEEKLALIQHYSGKTRTEIVREALDQYLQNAVEEIQQTSLSNNRKILEMLGGIAEGPEDLSERYKDQIEQGLKDKHGID
ncbi:MAG TPA: ribbon-helix-helix protein, CopG family [Gammaproteobacteria bacterium]|nr:ribbon-helix-helix protein, CopG family [Gammaproteobacteria bacterium]